MSLISVIKFENSHKTSPDVETFFLWTITIVCDITFTGVGYKLFNVS